MQPFLYKKLEEVSIYYFNGASKLGHVLNEKIFFILALVQALALKYPPPGSSDAAVAEIIRYKLKNEIKLLYRYVLESQSCLKEFHAGKMSRGEYQDKFVYWMKEQVD